MDTPLAIEKQLLADIDQLRGQFTQTQDLYREVCVLLFFRYGITPTGNKLYQLVRKGSMSAPTEALNHFWEDLREKSRTRIEHPDLPDELKTATGELAVAIWTKAQFMAQDSLASYRTDAQATVAEAKVATSAAVADRDATHLSLERSQQALAMANERVGALEQNIASITATNASLESQLHEAKAQNAFHLQRLEDVRRDFAAELEKLRAAAQLTEERYRSSESRALLEVDRERTVSTKLQKELDASRTVARQSVERLQAEAVAFQVQLGDLRQKTGALEGQLKAVTSNRDLLSNEIHDVRIQLTEATDKISLVRIEAEKWRRQAEQAPQANTESRSDVKAVRIGRKIKTEKEA